MAPETERKPGAVEMETHLSNNLGLQISNDGELLDMDLDINLPEGGWFSMLCEKGWLNELRAGMLPAPSNWEPC